MSISPAVAHHRAKIAAKSRVLGPDHPELLAAKRDLTAEKLAEHVQRAVEAAPPLTDEQRDRIAAILRGGAA